MIIPIKSLAKYFCLIFNYYKIPYGPYCYSIVEKDSNNQTKKIKLCPYWSINKNKNKQECGYCKWLEIGDWECEYLSLLWDQCKECNFKDV